ncbi:hypothetical protein [Variovorax sp. dw_954]|nr:hypothetical protein [Variovorax sp. dw_954]
MLDAAISSVGAELQILRVEDPEEVDPAFDEMERLKIGALVVDTPPLFYLNRDRIVDVRPSIACLPSLKDGPGRTRDF